MRHTCLIFEQCLVAKGLLFHVYFSNSESLVLNAQKSFVINDHKGVVVNTPR